MLRRLGRLFVIKTRWEALAVIYALALGAVDRGYHYVDRYPGVGGWLLFAACTGVVFMAGAKLLDMTRKDNGERRRRSDLSFAAAMSPLPARLGASGSATAAERGLFFPPDEAARVGEARHGPADTRIAKGGAGAGGDW